VMEGEELRSLLGSALPAPPQDSPPPQQAAEPADNPK
jgi:hypothetical protein